MKNDLATTAEETAREALRSIAEGRVRPCVSCGRLHTWRPNPDYKGSMTWADETDGHPLRQMDVAEFAAGVLRGIEG
jgi:hypothetical protein